MEEARTTIRWKTLREWVQSSLLSPDDVRGGTYVEGNNDAMCVILQFMDKLDKL